MFLSPCDTQGGGNFSLETGSLGVPHGNYTLLTAHPPPHTVSGSQLGKIQAATPSMHSIHGNETAL